MNEMWFLEEIEQMCYTIGAQRSPLEHAQEPICSVGTSIRNSPCVRPRVSCGVQRERILAIKERWPALPNTVVTIIAESSPSHVSEALNGKRRKGDKAR